MPSFSRNMWLLLAQNAAVFVGIALQALVLNLYIVALGYREDFVGLVAFAQAAVIGVGALPAGWLSSRLTPRLCLILGTTLLAITFAAIAVLESAVPLLIASALNGFAMAMIFVPMAPFLMENTLSDQRRIAFSANFAALALASVVGSAIGGQMPGLFAGDEVIGYRWTQIVGAVVALLGVVPILLADDRRLAEPARPVDPIATPATPPSSFRRDITAMSLATVALAAATALVVGFFNVFLRDEVGASTAAIGNVFAAGSLFMAPASLAAPALAKRFGAVPAIAASRLLMAPLIALLVLPEPGLALCAAIFVARTVFMSIGQPLDNAYILELVHPRDRARVSAFRTMAWNGGWATATALGGTAIVLFGYRPIFAAAVALTIVSVAVHWRAFSRRQP